MNQSLQSAIGSLRWKAGDTPWGDYYDTFSYSEESIRHKETLVEAFIERCAPGVVWDLGANTGRFSRIASTMGAYTVSMDIDPGAVEQNYRQVVANSEPLLLPLIIDLANPSPGLGWRSRERDGLLERGPVDAILALALIHHLAIGNNLPLSEIAQFFAQLCEWLLIEFVPKEDVQVQRMLSVREDIFDTYSISNFEQAFTPLFKIVEKYALQDSTRHLYIMRRIRNTRGND